MAFSLRKPLERVEPEAASKRPAQQPHAVGGLAANRAQQPNRGRAALVAFAVLVALRASVQQAFYGLLPKYFADLGFSPSEFGFMVGVISVALALGTMTGGILGDRYDQPKILLWSLLASAPFSWLILDIANAWFFFPLAFAAGFFIGVPHSILVVMAQRLLPGRQGLAERRHPWIHVCRRRSRHGGGRTVRGHLQPFECLARRGAAAGPGGDLRLLHADAHAGDAGDGPGSRVGGLSLRAGRF